MNIAMLGKLLWDVYVGKDKLWIRILTDKYMQHNSILQVPKRNGSYIWNSIMKSRDVLKDGFEFRVGNGESSLWYSLWTDFGALANIVNYVDIHDIHLIISDVHSNGAWNLNTLYTQLPQHIIDHIQGLNLILNQEVTDAMIWSGNIDRVYNAMSGCLWLRANRSSNLAANNLTSWKWIWGISGPEKLRLFVWTACQNAIPTAAMLHY